MAKKALFPSPGEPSETSRLTPKRDIPSLYWYILLSHRAKKTLVTNKSLQTYTRRFSARCRLFSHDEDTTGEGVGGCNPMTASPSAQQGPGCLSTEYEQAHSTVAFLLSSRALLCLLSPMDNTRSRKISQSSCSATVFFAVIHSSRPRTP